MFAEYVKSIIENGSYMPFASIYIPSLSIDLNGEVQGSEDAIRWAKECFEFIQKVKNNE